MSEEFYRHTRRSIRSINGYLDNAAGRAGENMTMLDLASQGYRVKYVGNDRTKHYDIHARRGREEIHDENKAGFHSRLTPAELERSKKDPHYRVSRTPRFFPRL